MRREKMLIAISVTILTGILVLTMTPLFLMFYTSFKPGGTLFKDAQDIMVANFDKGKTNSIGGVIGTREEVPASVIMGHGANRDQTQEGRSQVITYHHRFGGEVLWWTQLGQDLRKFRSFEFYARGELGGESFVVEFADINGEVISFHLKDLLPYGLSSRWQKIEIPVAALDLSKLYPGTVEKKAEEFRLRFDDVQSGTIYIDDIQLIFKKFTFTNYSDVIISGPFGRYFLNSAFIALLVTLGNLFLSSMVGYALARKEFPGKKWMFILIMSSIMIPPQVLMVPIFILMKNIGWLNTFPALIVPALVAPFNIFLMRQYISKLPVAMEDAARVDGASDFQIFFRIILPLTTPALAVVGINTFMGSWNTFLYPFILTNTTDMRTLPVGLALYKDLYGVDWVHLMAGSAVSAIPVIVVFLCFQRYIIAGLTAGSVKE
jgi:multiple sugar transport system permease protein